jgi:hypothetical protein
MDELYILGCLFLVFALLVAPVLAVIGFNRSTAAQQEIARLRQRIEALEQRGVPENAPEPVQTAAPEAITAPVVEDAPRLSTPGDPIFPQRWQNPPGPDPCGKTAFCLWRHPDVAGALVHAGQSAGEAGHPAALPRPLFPAALYRRTFPVPA